jgi:YD repeat-containing protein
MKLTPTASVLMVFVICLFACKKSNTGTNPPKGSSKPVRIASSGTNYTPTVFLINYNSAGNITSIDDSVAGIIYTATYDASGNLVHISQMQGSTAGDSATYTYNIQGEMTGANISMQGTVVLTTYYYTAGLLMSDSTYYFVGGIPNSFSFSTYLRSGGNISAIQTGSSGSSNGDTIDLTYTSAANPFKQLSLFNYSAGLQNSDVASPYTFFSQNPLAGYTYTLSTGTVVETSTYTYDSENRIIEAKAFENWGANGTYTYDWLISY